MGHDGRDIRTPIKGLPPIRVRQRWPLPDSKGARSRSRARPGGHRRPRVRARARRSRAVGRKRGHRPRVGPAPDAQHGRDHRARARGLAGHRSKPGGPWRRRRGSNHRPKRVPRLARLRRRAAVRGRNAWHRTTNGLARRFDIIAVEDLQVDDRTASARGGVKASGWNVGAKTGLHRSILEQAWGRIVAQLDYKAAWASRPLVKIDPRYTSQHSRYGRWREQPDGRKLWWCPVPGRARRRRERRGQHPQGRAFQPAPSPRLRESSRFSVRPASGGRQCGEHGKNTGRRRADEEGTVDSRAHGAPCPSGLVAMRHRARGSPSPRVTARSGWQWHRHGADSSSCRPGGRPSAACTLDRKPGERSGLAHSRRT